MPIGLNNDLNNLGILTGTIGTDYRNLINRTHSRLTRLANPTTNPTTNSTTTVSSGVGFSYTPINVNSKLIITFQLNVNMSYNALVGTVYGLIKSYVDTSLVPLMSATIPLVTSTQINSQSYYNGLSYFQSGTGLIANNSYMTLRIEHIPQTTNIRYYYLGFSVDTSAGQYSFGVSTDIHYAQYTVEEYI